MKQKTKNQLVEWMIVILFGILFGAMFAWGGVNKW